MQAQLQSEGLTRLLYLQNLLGCVVIFEVASICQGHETLRKGSASW